MDYLPQAILQWLEGSIDPLAQHLVETYSQPYLIILTALAFAASYLTQSVLISLEIFIAGFCLLMFLAVPPWPYLQRHPIKFLPVRKTAESLSS